ncbi:MAG: FG-GAP-like repeat-containing protein [Saprospiraceae bacterium]
MKKNYFCCLMLTLAFSFNAQSQINFTNQNILLPNSDFHSGVAIAIADMNGDGKDDIARMDQGHQLNIEFQTNPNNAFTNMYVGDLGNWSNWSICAGDLDNNGFLEVMADGVLATANADGTNYTIDGMPGANFFVQATNFADINNDGYLDAFLCNDDGESGIWGNDGNGNLVQQDSWIDMSVNGSSGEPASGNYGSVWTDFDNDGDIDLYIAKCRQGVTNADDPRRINVLYVNDGNNNYTEMGEEYGLKVKWQSWTADFQDVNNDGWMDCFITNHDHASQLLINDGTGHYTEAMNTGINVTGLPIQGVMRDFDNDGFVDILVSGYSGQIFRNNGDLTFTEVTGIFDNNDMESFALGDLNSDGFVDVYGGYATIYTNPSSIDDVLWMNAGNSNNHLSVNLQGTISNRNAVGARIEIYGDWGIQVREVRAGESYGIMNSMSQYFGLGTATEVDSMIVRWPSGIVQTEYELNINTSIQLLEGDCLATTPSIDFVGATTLCSGESTTLNAPAGYANYEWSNGEITQNIEVSTQGFYQLTATDNNGCVGFSTSIFIEVDPVLSPEIIANGDIILCEGESVELSEIATPNALSYTWSNGTPGATLTVTESGSYNIVVEGPCQNFTSNSIIVDVSEYPNPPSSGGVTILVGEQANLVSSGNNIAWYDVPTGGVPLFIGDNFTTPNLSTSTTYYVEDRNGLIGLNENVGQEEHSGSLFSQNLGDNNGLLFDAYDEFTIDSITVYTDIEALRRIVVYDQSFTEVVGVDVMIPAGENTIYVGLDIPVGNDWRISTDFNTNFNNLGTPGPRLQRSDENLNFPYTIQDVVSIKNSAFSDNLYYYFYDWKISTPDILCASDRTPVEVTVDDDVAIVDISKSDLIDIFPNPNDGNFSIDLKFEVTETVTYNLSDMTGKMVIENQLTQKINPLNLSHLPKGIYALQIIHGKNIYQGKVVLQ